MYHKGKKCIDLSYGKTAHFYDLASITKPMLTSTRLMMLREDKIFHENDMVKKQFHGLNHLTLLKDC